ncbi:hypothetical protein AcV7_001729 [Taiwanofungus camphoratus]|nr:hypothetical protein AcV7_001729 [Antrodia cinnamomea]
MGPEWRKSGRGARLPAPIASIGVEDERAANAGPPAFACYAHVSNGRTSVQRLLEHLRLWMTFLGGGGKIRRRDGSDDGKERTLVPMCRRRPPRRLGGDVCRRPRDRAGTQGAGRDAQGRDLG